METNIWIGILGSVASIIGIPLAVYLYFRQKASGIEKVKSIIIKNLSHQIGDRRIPNEFQIESTIKSKLRSARIKPEALSVNEIIEDLATEINENPLLDGENKTLLISSMEAIHRKRSQNDNNFSEEITTSRNLISFVSMMASVVTILTFYLYIRDKTKFIDPKFGSTAALIASMLGALASVIFLLIKKSNQNREVQGDIADSEMVSFAKLKDIMTNQVVPKSDDDPVFAEWVSKNDQTDDGLDLLKVFQYEVDRLLGTVEPAFIENSEAIKYVYRKFQLFQLIEPDPISVDLAMSRKQITYTISPYGKKFFTFIEELNGNSS